MAPNDGILTLVASPPSPYCRLDWVPTYYTAEVIGWLGYKKTVASVLDTLSCTLSHLHFLPWGKPDAMLWGSPVERPMCWETKTWHQPREWAWKQIPHQLGIQKRTQVQPAASLSSHEAPEARGTWLDFTQIFDLQKMCEIIHIFLSY